MTSKTYWQIAAGAVGRNYANQFLKFGMAFVGGETQITTMAQVAVGDIVLLKMGTSKVIAVGEVVEREGKHGGNEDNSWREFDGWDLSAYCYVDWHVPDPPKETDGLTRATIQKVRQAKHKELADSLLNLPIHPYVPEPIPVNEIEDEDILKFLIREGLRPSAADELTNTLRRIRLLADYYYSYPYWEDIREHETRSFLIIPLLLALGWAEQQIKIELPSNKGRMDIACFSQAYHRNNEDCQLIIEAKGFASGLDYAPEKAKRYAAAFPSCHAVVVSNGYCYKTYLSQEGKFDTTTPYAYLNLLRPTNKYPLNPTIEGALKVLKWLLPETLRENPLKAPSYR